MLVVFSIFLSQNLNQPVAEKELNETILSDGKKSGLHSKCLLNLANS